MKKVLILIALVLISCIVVVGSHAEKIPTTYRKTIPIYNVATGTFTNETFTAVTTYMQYNLLSSIKKINGLKYRVYTGATYVTNGVTFGPIGDFASVNEEGLTCTYNPNEYSLRVQATPYYITYTYYTQGSRSTSGQLSFGGSGNGSGTSSGYKYHYRQLIQ